MITIIDLRKLRDMQKEGKPLPEGWQTEVNSYVLVKRRAQSLSGPKEMIRLRHLHLKEDELLRILLISTAESRRRAGFE